MNFGQNRHHWQPNTKAFSLNTGLVLPANDTKRHACKVANVSQLLVKYNSMSEKNWGIRVIKILDIEGKHVEARAMELLKGINRFHRVL